MAEAAKKKATYEDLYSIPENTIGEIINGALIVSPRPSRRHTYAASALETNLAAPYQFGRGGGPGGWIIIVEPEIGLAEHIMVPDLAGWRKQRFPVEEDHNWISATPDWICEILSPKTASLDKAEKMPIYARYGVEYAWIIDPMLKTLDVYRLESEGWWRLVWSYGENDKMRAEPFKEVEIDLGDLWIESSKP
ncbi:MAG: Uma2 family endonuclease [Syntrophobacteraceae bacterium]|nr:Uma2 family endonuclease [Syntrophobacteraceae bacterium]